MQLHALKVLQRLNPDNRNADRVRLALPGRYMLSDGSEHLCWTIDVSPIGAAIAGHRTGKIGEHVIAYIDQIGRIEGVVSRLFDGVFALKLSVPAIRREKLASKIAWIVDHREHGAPDNRNASRVTPHNWRTKLHMPDGRGFLAAVLDVSIPGAALDVEVAPPIGSRVTVGDTPATVVRHFPGGMAVAFENHLSAEILIAAERGEDERDLR